MAVCVGAVRRFRDRVVSQLCGGPGEHEPDRRGDKTTEVDARRGQGRDEGELDRADATGGGDGRADRGFRLFQEVDATSPGPATRLIAARRRQPGRELVAQVFERRSWR